MLFSQDQESKRTKKSDPSLQGNLIYKTVVPTGESASTYRIPVAEKSVKEHEQHGSKGLFESAKDAIVETISSGIESVKTLIHDIAEPIKGHEQLPRAAERENPELRYDIKTKKHRISRTTIEQFPRAGEDLDIKHEKKQKKKSSRKIVDYMQDYRDTGIPGIGISPLHNDHKTVHEKRFKKTSSTSTTGSKMSSVQGEQSAAPELGISLMQRERCTYRRKQYPTVFKASH